ncbi:diaminopimelate epimerase [Caldalkalibacillus salinus]|uniref:diaminopimelate epimerase n=1 Tax=Caldalkalibacillus salinus TaxID=2803787 RepID=UPI0019237CF9|nr:diaminopimelate epimerase [Caldalkalibacillus salinus]
MTKAVKFTKMHALGNNYIYINQFEEPLEEDSLPSLARKVSEIQTGIGSDGMILIAPSKTADIKMRVFNSDGSEAKNCGNGLRCVARYVYDHSIVNKTQFQIETLGGIVDANINVDHGVVQSVTIDMGQPRLEKAALPMFGEDLQDQATDEQLDIDGETISFVGVSMGNPHAVIFVDDINEAPVETLGPKIEKHECFPEWINVEFIKVINEKEIDFRVWERGSGVTYACGTGACAAVVAAHIRGLVPQGKPITVHLLGGDLEISWHTDAHVWMTGPAEYICTGEFYTD